MSNPKKEKVKDTIHLSKISGIDLDLLVARCEGKKIYQIFDDHINVVDYSEEDERSCFVPYSPTTNMSLGGEIILRERISVSDWNFPNWRAWFCNPRKHPTDDRKDPSLHCYDGETFLIAAMRCYVASVMGDEIDPSLLKKEL